MQLEMQMHTKVIQDCFKSWVHLVMQNGNHQGAAGWCGAGCGLPSMWVHLQHVGLDTSYSVNKLYKAQTWLGVCKVSINCMPSDARNYIQFFLYR